MTTKDTEHSYGFYANSYLTHDSNTNAWAVGYRSKLPVELHYTHRPEPTDLPVESIEVKAQHARVMRSMSSVSPVTPTHSTRRRLGLCLIVRICTLRETLPHCCVKGSMGGARCGGRVLWGA